MNPWILVAAAGGIACIAGMTAVFGRYRRGEVSGRYLAAVVVGVLSFGSYALVSAVRPDLGTGAVSLLLLLPGLLAVVAVAREHERAGKLQE